MQFRGLSIIMCRSRQSLNKRPSDSFFPIPQSAILCNGSRKVMSDNFKVSPTRQRLKLVMSSWDLLEIFFFVFISWQSFLESSFTQWPGILNLSINRGRKDGEWQVVVEPKNYMGYSRYGAFIPEWPRLHCFQFMSISPSKHTPCAWRRGVFSEDDLHQMLPFHHGS